MPAKPAIDELLIVSLRPSTNWCFTNTVFTDTSETNPHLIMSCLGEYKLCRAITISGSTSGSVVTNQALTTTSTSTTPESTASDNSETNGPVSSEG